MPVVINDETYYRTAEVCRMVGISRHTLFRWIKEGIFPTSSSQAWRLFTTAQMETLRMKASPATAINRRS